MKSTEIKAALESLRRLQEEQAKLRGRREALLETLDKEFGVRDLKVARKKLDELGTRFEKAAEDLDAKLSALAKKYPLLFG